MSYLSNLNSQLNRLANQRSSIESSLRTYNQRKKDIESLIKNLTNTVKTMAQIRITPEELRGAADFLEQKLEAINGEVSALKGKIDEITANWEGSAQSSFIDTFDNNMYPILKDTLPEVITGIAAQLDGAADAIEQADAEVAKAFKG